MPKPFHPDELVLLSAVHDSPMKNAPRLKYAAWLAAHDQPEHAELIRLQCQSPYFAITSRGLARPARSFCFEFGWDDAPADPRLDRMAALLSVIYLGDRYAHHRDMPYYEEHFRGLPVPEVQLHAEQLPDADKLLDAVAPLARLDLTIHDLDLRTNQLWAWLAHPIIRIVDVLRLQPASGPRGRQQFANPHIEALDRPQVVGRVRELVFKGEFEGDAEDCLHVHLFHRMHVSVAD